MSYHTRPVEERLQDFQNLDYVSQRNKELFTEFIRYLQADQNIGEKRTHKYIGEFKVILEPSRLVKYKISCRI